MVRRQLRQAESIMMAEKESIRGKSRITFQCQLLQRFLLCSPEASKHLFRGLKLLPPVHGLGIVLKVIAV
jgi:hypothetical protein